MPGKPLRPMKKKANPLHAKGITEIDWKDTALLRQFISDRGKIRARRVTGVIAASLTAHGFTDVVEHDAPAGSAVSARRRP